MPYETKPKGKMSFSATRENSVSRDSRQNSRSYSKSLTFFPLPQKGSDHLCQDINRNLFQLEKQLAYFNFAVKELKDITHT